MNENERDDGLLSWPFFDGSIAISASILLANAINKCDRCAGWPAISVLKKLTEQDDGVIIAGTALLFPTTVVLYGGFKMVLMAYREHKRKHEAWKQKIREEGRQAERIRLKRELAEQGINLPPEAEKILSGESSDNS